MSRLVPPLDPLTLRTTAVTSKKEQSRWDLRWDLSLSRGRPFGYDEMAARTVKALGLENTVRGKGGNQYGKEAAR